MMKKRWLLKFISALIAMMVVTGCNNDDTDNDTNNQEEMQPGEDTNEGVGDDENDAVPDEEDAVEDAEDMNDADNTNE